MDIHNISEEEKKRNLGLCTSAGIETPSDEDPTRFQRRHFPNRMTSDIFFSDSPSPLENASRKSGDGYDIFASAGMDTRYNDQKQSEKRHFHLSSEDGTMTRDYEDEKELVDSFEPAESRKSVGRDDCLSEGMDKHNAAPKQSDKRHFHLSTLDGIMTSDFANQDEREQVDSFEPAEPRKSVGRDDCLSEGMDKHNAAPKQSDKRHFHLSTLDGTMTRDFPNQDEREQVHSFKTAESRKCVGRDDYLSEEMDKRHAYYQQKPENQHFYLSTENGTMTNDFVNRDEEDVKSSGTAESGETEDDSDQKTQRRHFYDKMSSNIFFSGLPIENMSLKDPADPSDFRKRKG